MKLGAVVVVTFVCCWIPFLQDTQVALQVLNRLFPVARGIFEVFTMFSFYSVCSLCSEHVCMNAHCLYWVLLLLMPCMYACLTDGAMIATTIVLEASSDPVLIYNVFFLKSFSL